MTDHDSIAGLLRDARATLLELRASIDVVHQRADAMGVQPHRVLTADGTPTLAPLLAARAHLLAALLEHEHRVRVEPGDMGPEDERWAQP